MHASVKTVAIQEGGFIDLSQDELGRLGAKVSDHLGIDEVGDRCARLYKATAPEEDDNSTSRS